MCQYFIVLCTYQFLLLCTYFCHYGKVGDFAILLRAGFDRWKAVRMQLCTALGGVLGACFALCSQSQHGAGEIPQSSDIALLLGLYTTVQGFRVSKMFLFFIKPKISLKLVFSKGPCTLSLTSSMHFSRVRGFVFVILSYQNICYRCENADNRI